MEEITVLSNWYAEGDGKLNNLVTYCTSENMECCIENVTTDTCICLTEGDQEGPHLKPELEIKCKYPIKEMNVFSEGSLIEIFGLHDEYLETCTPIFIDDWEGMAVYQARISLPDIMRCKLKFTRIKEKSRLWLYSVQILVNKPREPSNHFLFNIDNVNKLIYNHNISDKAERFKKVFETYAKNSQNINCDNSSVQFLLHMMSRGCNLEVPKSASQCLSDSNISTPTESSNSASVVGNNNELPLDCDMKSYIERSMREMKEEIMASLESKLEELREEQNAKLDKIIKLLEESKM